MPAESLDALQLRSGFSALDCTTGLGGHTRLLSQAVGPNGHVYACDTDSESLAMARANCVGSDSPITFIHTPFSKARQALDAIGDLALAGAPLMATYRSSRGGHKLNHAVLCALMADPTAWTYVTAGAPVRRRAEAAADLVA